MACKIQHRQLSVIFMKRNSIRISEFCKHDALSIQRRILGESCSISLSEFQYSDPEYATNFQLHDRMKACVFIVPIH